MFLRLEALESRENPAGPVLVDPLAPPEVPVTPVVTAPEPAPEPAPVDPNPIPVDPTIFWW